MTAQPPDHRKEAFVESAPLGPDASKAGTDTNLALLGQAARALAEVSNAADAWQLSRTAEAARRWAQMRGLGTEAVNHATAVKAKALILLANYADAGQADGTIQTRADTLRQGRAPVIPRENNGGAAPRQSMADVLGVTEDDPKQAAAKAAKAVHGARKLRDVLATDGKDPLAAVDALVRDATDAGEDLGLRGLRMSAAATHRPEPVATPVPVPSGLYSAVVIDPPWPMKKIERNERPNQGVELDYPTMPIACQRADPALGDVDDGYITGISCHKDEGGREPCQSIECVVGAVLAAAAHDNCHIYLWVTHKFLPAGLDLLDAWGFRYQCPMTWRKNVGITPFSWMYDTEHVLFGTRGSLPLERKGLRLSFEAPVQGHSVKPDVFYERVIAASPGPRLEMFARRQRDGFEAWGNEVPADAV